MKGKALVLKSLVREGHLKRRVEQRLKREGTNLKIRAGVGGGRMFEAEVTETGKSLVSLRKSREASWPRQNERGENRTRSGR